MKRRSVLSPRGGRIDLPDIASRGRLIAGQRIDGARLRKRVARRARWVVGRIALVATALAVVTAGVVGANWLSRSPRFAVASVEVAGAERMTREQIAAAAGIPPGVSIFAIDSEAAVDRLEALPLVRRAELIRALPNRVTVVVEERRPFALVNTGRLHWVDEDGVDLGRESRAIAVPTPVLSGLAASDLGAANHRPPTARAAQGLSLLRLLSRAQSPLLVEISEVDVSRAEGPVLYTVERHRGAARRRRVGVPARASAGRARPARRVGRAGGLRRSALSRPGSAQTPMR